MRKELLMAFFLFLVTPLLAQTVDIESLRPQIDKYLSLAVAGGIEKYGFSNINEIGEIQYGEPIQTIEMEQNFYSDESATGEYCMQDVNEFRIPLIVNDTIRSFAVVVGKNGKWFVVDFGASTLAKRVDKCYRDYGIQKHQKVKMLRDTYSSTDYIELSEDDYVIVEENVKDGNALNKPFNTQQHHHSKNDVKHELHQHYKSANLHHNNQRNKDHER